MPILQISDSLVQSMFPDYPDAPVLAEGISDPLGTATLASVHVASKFISPSTRYRRRD